jgi:hypothetical protein
MNKAPVNVFVEVEPSGKLHCGYIPLYHQQTKYYRSDIVEEIEHWFIEAMKCGISWYDQEMEDKAFMALERLKEKNFEHKRI